MNVFNMNNLKEFLKEGITNDKITYIKNQM